jgi:hypothetical protein
VNKSEKVRVGWCLLCGEQMLSSTGYNFDDPECFFANSSIHTCDAGRALWTGGREAYDAYIREEKRAGVSCDSWQELFPEAKDVPDFEW